MIGKELAEAMASYLKKYRGFAYFHRDYCGPGFWMEKGIFYFTHFYDGWPRLSEEPGWDNVIKKFITREDFISWLSVQTDESLLQVGGDNQPMSIERIKTIIRL